MHVFSGEELEEGREFVVLFFFSFFFWGGGGAGVFDVGYYIFFV